MSPAHLAQLGMVALLLFASGCAQPSRPRISQWFAGSETEEPSADKLANDPKLRTERYRELAASAKKQSVEEQNALCAELAAEFDKEQDPLIEVAIVRTAGAFSTPAASGILVAGLQDSDRDVRIESCSIWGFRGGPDAGRLLTETVASDANLDVRLAATRALGLLKDDPHAREGLQVAVADSDPAMQYRAIEALKNYTGEDYGNDVVAWRSYLKTGVPPEKPAWSVAELWKGWF